MTTRSLMGLSIATPAPNDVVSNPLVSIATGFVVIATLAGRVHAQEAQRAAFLLEVVAAGYTTAHPEGSPIGLGFAIGLERSVAPSLGIRATLSRLQAWVIGDDIALCHLLPDDSCLPDSVFPGTLWTVDALTVWQPAAQIPVNIVGGGGLLFAEGRAVGDGARSDPKVPAGGHIFWRTGLEIRLGSAPRAPRLQLTRSGLLDDVLSLDGLFTLTLQLRP